MGRDHVVELCSLGSVDVVASAGEMTAGRGRIPGWSRLRSFQVVASAAELLMGWNKLQSLEVAAFAGKLRVGYVEVTE